MTERGPCSFIGCEGGSPVSVWQGRQEKEVQDNLLHLKPTGWRSVSSRSRRWGGSRLRGRPTAAGSWRWRTRSARPPGSEPCMRRCLVIGQSGWRGSFLCWCSRKSRRRGQVLEQVEERQGGIVWSGGGGAEKVEGLTLGWIQNDPWLKVVVWLQLEVTKASMSESSCTCTAALCHVARAREAKQS